MAQSPQIQPLPSIPTIKGLGHPDPLTLHEHRTHKLSLASVYAVQLFSLLHTTSKLLKAQA